MKIFTPFFTDKQKESPLSTPNIPIPQTMGAQSESYTVDYGDNFSQRSEPETISETLTKTSSGIDVGNMQEVLDTLNKHGIKYRLTSGKRTRKISNAGSKSHHLTGNAIDIVPIDGMS